MNWSLRDTHPERRKPQQPIFPQSFHDYLIGQRIYLRRQHVTDCTNADQVRGWTDALRYDAQCQVDMPANVYPRGWMP